MNRSRLLDGRLKIRHLVLVTTIADQGSVIRAAEAMHISQPVVTRGLREAEEIVGSPLFDRLPRGVRPTAYGLTFLSYARAVLAQLRAAEEHLAVLSSGELGQAFVGTHLAGSNLLLPRAIAALKRQHPLLTVTVREATPDTLHQQLIAGELDVVVGRLTPTTNDQLQQIRLYDEPIRLVARPAHPAHELAEPSLADLTDYPWIFPVAETALRSELEQVFLAEDVPLPANRVECTSMLTLRHLLISTDVIAALPMFIATQDDALRLCRPACGSPVGSWA
ncbi:LysR substrate-binding domain-containing protein [Enemella dayhoffiae]|uniref:LysR substrate-binding domain-containing protein n=1 Tax=Enemella dayhoffiae TaxID=2016507 RepID=UPI00113FC40D|nr:LysR substrate-binding domain-containing protein [Enemella dayhoffiae]